MTSVPLATGRPDFPAETDTAHLLGYGRITWDQLTAMLAGAQAAWADYAGFHVGPAPAEPPPYFHLWAWTPQWLARARIELGTAITGVLALHGEPAQAPAVLSRETVDFQRTQARTWPQEDKRVGRLPDHIAGQLTDIYLIAGDRPITFVAARTDSGGTGAAPAAGSG